MYETLHLDLHTVSLVNRGKSNELGLKLTQDPLKYATCPEAELRPGKNTVIGGVESLTY